MPRVKRNIQDGYNSSFAKRLRELIEDKEITQNQLSQIIGKTRQAINNYTLGNTAPDADTLIKLSEYFDVSVDYLLGLSNVKTTNEDIKYICDYTGLSEDAINSLHIRLPKGALNTFFENEYYFVQFLTSFDIYIANYKVYVSFKEKCVNENIFEKNTKELHKTTYNLIDIQDKFHLSEYKLNKSFDELIRKCVNPLIERENKTRDSFEILETYAMSKTLDDLEQQLFGEKLIERKIDNGND